MADLNKLLAAASDQMSYDTQTNAVATASIAAKTGFCVYVTNIEVSFSAAPTASVTFTLKSGTTVKKTYQLPANAQSPCVINFHRPLKMTVSEKAEVSCTDPGVAITQTVGLAGFYGSPS